MLYLDTYALLALIDGASSYTHLAGQDALTHDMNLLEAAAQMLKRGDPDPWLRLETLRVGNVSHDREDLRAAAALKAAPIGRRRNLSYVDALGYAIAQRLGLPFVTGDRGFEGLEGVEFIPAR